MSTQPQPDRLDAVLDQAWSLLIEGAARRQSPFHQGVLANLGDAGPEARYVVLRRAEREQARLAFHTDRRSPKLGQLQKDPRASWCFFGEGVQLRLAGRATPCTDGERVEAAWQRTSTFGRRCYTVGNAPGAVLIEAGSGLPAESLQPGLAPALVDLGREHFALVEFQLERIDWLHLAHSGHRRARFEADDGWQGRWVQP
ncbi:pyridoxamine 5'-phosphate oxidase family protein [Aquimonas voraii]|uniref:Pyridoxamine 5'-phosphate oxidase n=1 Tax=Aquimonas voraii TaxID=265719 RepID=A0A1G6WT75_9GAMM|nr:pyridoxamine 5'-phosphate oxidase family protein [Aquimonas voraii]SDD69098.1 Pyridoxamine 5'-phosphate oxidase [Aquimonas voraii]